MLLARFHEHCPEGSSKYNEIRRFYERITKKRRKVEKVEKEEVEDDDEAFADKMQTLTARLSDQMAKGAELDALIRQKLGGLGYEF